MNEWLRMNAKLTSFTESELVDELDREQDGLARARFLLRLHQRYTKLRAYRERVALLQNVRGV